MRYPHLICPWWEQRVPVKISNFYPTDIVTFRTETTFEIFCNVDVDSVHTFEPQFH